MNWPVMRLGDLGRWFGGGTPPKGRAEFWDGGLVPWLSPKDMGEPVLSGTIDHITERAVLESAVRMVPSGSIAVVVRSGILERTLPVALVPFETTLNQDMKALVPTSGVDSRWVAWGLRAYEDYVLTKARKTGTTVASIEMTRFMEIQLPVPGIREQHRIIALIEELTSDLETAVGALVSAKKKARSLVSLWAEVELRRSVGSRVTLREASSLIVDGDHNPPARVPYGVPHLTAKNIQGGGITLEGCSFVSEEGFTQTASRYSPREGDIIVTCVGTIGRVAVVPPGIRFSADRNLAAIRLRGGILPEYVASLLDSVSMQRIMSTASGSTAQPHLYLRDIRALSIPVPGMDEQAEHVRRHAHLRDGEARLFKTLETHVIRSVRLRKGLLAAAFAGRLTGRSSDSDVIEELVEQGDGVIPYDINQGSVEER